MPEEPQPPPVPALPQYLTAHHFALKKQAGPLNKLLSRMLKPRMHRMMKTQLKSTKKKHQVKFY